MHVGKYMSEGRFAAGEAVTMQIDQDLRKINARNHSAGHLLDMAMWRAGRTELKPSKGYHFADGAYVEYIGNVDEKERQPLVDTLNKHC